MSKNKKVSKINVRLETGEACVVADVETWEHIISVYTILAEDAPEEERPYWEIIIGNISKWVEDTLPRDVGLEDENEF
jgi:hypothetical protein